MSNEVYSIEDITEDKKEFVIDTDSKAEWAINIIKQEQAEQERLVNIIDDEIAILLQKKERILNNDKTLFLKGKLAQYFELISEENKKDLKSCIKYKLPSGDLVFKKSQIKYERNDDKILNWLMDHNYFEYVKTNPTVDWAELKKLPKETLQTIDGITEIQTVPEFSITFTKE